MSQEKGSGKGRMSFTDLASFFENMGMMVKAGITAHEALDLLREEAETDGGALAPVYRRMSEKLSEGASLEDAMRDTGVFPDYAADMTGASEYTGKLEGSLFHLSDYYRTEEEMKNTFVSAVRYPLILLIMVTAVLAVMRFMVFPAFYGVYENLAGSISASSYSWIEGAFLLCRILMAVMILLVIVMLIGIAFWKKGKADTVRNLLSKVRTFRDLFDNLDLYRFTACFDMFISGGAMQDEALEKSKKVAESPGLRARLERCAEKMEAGASFSQAACDEKLYDPINNRMLIPAERSGMLDSILQKILGTLKSNNEKYVGRIANTVEPLLTGFLMITIGLMLVSLMLPLIGIMNSIG